MAMIGGVRPALAATAMDVPNPSGPKSNSWLPKVVASKPIRNSSCSSDPVSRVVTPSGTVAVVTIIEHRYRAQSFPRRLPRRDQRAKTCVTAADLVIIQLKWAVVRLRGSCQ